MRDVYALCAGLPALLDAASAALPALQLKGLGVVRAGEEGTALFTYRDDFGASGYAAPPLSLPEPFRPRASGVTAVSPSTLERNPTGLVESRLLLTTFPDEIREPRRLGQIVTMAVPKPGRPPTILIAGAGVERELQAAEMAQLETLASAIARLLEHRESRDEELERLRRLEKVERLLPAFVHVLDVREIFERLSEITNDVMPHEFATAALFNDTLTELSVYAATSSVRDAQYTGPMPVPPSQTAAFLCRLVPDMQLHPTDRTRDFSCLAGGRASIRVVLRLNDRTIGAIAFASREVACYTALDFTIARRVADYVALGISHYGLADEARRAAVLEERNAKLEVRVRTLTEELDSRTGYRRMAGESKVWTQVLTEATKVAATDTTVLLLGESGTGKEVVARFLHRASPRNHGPFIAMNCAALPDQLLEAELFGYERGAYTGATQSKPGQLEQASGGTLFLDEVGEMSLSSQAKFLRVLQEREFQRLGGTRILKSDARIVAATNRDLEKAMALGQFREDLFYRLNVFAIQLPSLRERHDDILPLTEAFLAEFSQRFGKPPAGISRDARRILLEHHWPGNVRELRNTLERAAILCEGGLITPEHLPAKMTAAHSTMQAVAPSTVTSAGSVTAAAGPAAAAGDIVTVERAMIEQALQNTRFNKSKTARMLGLTRQQLYVRMRKYGLE